MFNHLFLQIFAINPSWFTRMTWFFFYSSENNYILGCFFLYDNFCFLFRWRSGLKGDTDSNEVFFRDIFGDFWLICQRHSPWQVLYVLQASSSVWHWHFWRQHHSVLCAKCALRRTLRIVFAMRHLKTLYRFDCLHKKIWLIKNRSFLQFTYFFFNILCHLFFFLYPLTV